MPRTANAIRNLAIALSLPLIGAATMSHPSPAQTQAAAPTTTTTGVLVILTAKPGIAHDQIMAVMPAEVRATVQLYLGGKIRE